VAAEAVLEDGRALESFADGQFGAGEAFFDIGAGAQGSCGTGGEHDTAQVGIGAANGVEDFFHGGACDRIVPEVVGELVELVEDHHIVAGALKLHALVEDFLDVGLTAGGCDDFLGHGLEPLEALAAHLGGENGDARAGEEAGNVGTAAAVVASARPDCLLGGGVEAAGDQLGREACICGADLVGAGGEPLAGKADNARLRASNCARDFDVIDRAIGAAEFFWFIVPGDAEEVTGMYIPQPNVRKFLFDGFGNFFRVAHLCECWEQDAFLTAAFDILFALRLVDVEIDHR